MSDDYITRGVFYLIGWFATVPLILGFIGQLTFGGAGMLLGMAIALIIGLMGYNAYLNHQYNKRYGKRQP